MRISVPNILVGKVEGAGPVARLTRRLIIPVDYLGEQYAALALFTSPARARAFLSEQDASDSGVVLLDAGYLQACLANEQAAVATVIDPPGRPSGDARGFFIQDIMRAFHRATSPDDVMIIRADQFRLLSEAAAETAITRGSPIRRRR